MLKETQPFLCSECGTETIVFDKPCQKCESVKIITKQFAIDIFGLNYKDNFIKDKDMHHLLLLSGGHSSALVTIEVVNEYGKENCTLLNHNINPMYESDDIKRFKQEIADYVGLPITYANYKNVLNPDLIPDQFDVCIEAGALTSPDGKALCTALLKTIPFYDFLKANWIPYSTLFEEKKDVIIYYGFDSGELVRVQRRSTLMAAKGYKTKFPNFKGDLKIKDTREIGITPPNTYSIFKHANCIGCLKAGLLHWYVVYCLFPHVYDKGSRTEILLDYTIHRVTRDKVTTTISLEELRPIYESIKLSGVEATEHQSERKFGFVLRKYQIEQCNVAKPCECSE